VVLATTAADGTRLYQADEEARRAVVHLVGDTKGNVKNAVETFQVGYLYGFHMTLPELLSVRFSSTPRTGDDVTLTVDSRLSTEILRAFSRYNLTRGKNGAAVVMNYRTGELLALLSLPTFDPMALRLPSGGSYYYNRAVYTLYPPGSTFKIITTASALENLPGAADMLIDCTGGLRVDGQVINDFGAAIHGELTLKQAFVKSCNIAYAKLALQLQDQTLQKTAAAFGFDDYFLFRDLVVTDSVYNAASSGTARNGFAVATSGFGQGSIGATPLHMCLVAAGVANDGVIMEPTLLRAVHSGVNGKLRDTFAPREYRRAVSPETAATLQEYMRAVVTSGTGTRAAVPGLTICGKTGSAETVSGSREVTHGWFVGYCADEGLPFAVAILVEDIGDGEGGGSTAAPIAHDVFQYLRDHRSDVLSDAE